AILIATAVLSYTDRQVLSLLVDPIRGELGISDTQVSLLLGTAFAVVYGIAGIPLGFLADRTSRRNLIFAGVVVWSCGTLACGFSHSFGQLFAARIVVGLGEAVLSPAAISLISDYFPPARRGTAVGFFLSGIAMGIGAAILIGGGVLHVVESGVLAGTPLAGQPAWRLVLLLIGAPGLLWSLAILLIKEPARKTAEDPTDPGDAAATGASTPTSAPRSTPWSRVIPIYLVVATASLVDNAVGAWAPTLLIREFTRDPAQIGVQLGFLLTAGFGGGVLLGGWLADRAGSRGGSSYKLGVCLLSGLLILPVSLLINASEFHLVLLSVPLYFALSGVVTACGFSAILDVVPNRSRGLAMAISFFLNVALGAGLGPSAVTAASDYVFGVAAGLGPAITLTVAAGYAVAAGAALTGLSLLRARRPANPGEVH
ncbi:MAG TPA: MFS transporter, partial [Steroidobacteraceae bacterium]|nr:MFS transporter [Steroidobacteraceae bacterium]